MSSTTDVIFKMKTAIDTDRTDIVCALLSELQKNANDADLLKKVLGETKLEGGTLLHYATKLGKQDKVRALLSAGADPCVPNAEGKLPLDGAPANMRSVYNEELLQATAQSKMTEEPSDDSSTSPVQSVLAFEERKYLVFQSSLLELFKVCSCCCSPVKPELEELGTLLTVTAKCDSCQNVRQWRSQPLIGEMPVGNLLLSSCILFSGSLLTKTFRLLDCLNMARMSDKTFYSHQQKYLQPTVINVWLEEQAKVIDSLKEVGGMLELTGDGRSDSPGHCAKYGGFNTIECRINKVIDVQVVQSNEVGNSARCENEGLQRTFLFLHEAGLEVGSIVTDRHKQNEKYIREQKPNVKHYFDVWHVAKNSEDYLALLNIIENKYLLNDVKKLSPSHQTSQLEAFHSLVLSFCPKHTAFSWLGMYTSLGRVCQLLAAGVEVNLTDSEETQSTPLHWAASYGNRDMVQCLCTRGAQVNRFNNAGMTPLHEAVRRGDRSVVEELLAFGADPELAVSSGEHVGQTSHDLAGNREDLTQALQAPRSYSSHPAARGDLANGLHPIPGSKANLVRFDSYASGDGLLNGVDIPPSPSLPSPSFKKLNKEDAEGNNVTLKGVRSEEKLNLLWPQPQSMVQGGGKPFLINDLLTVLILPSPGHICPGQVAEMWNIRRSRFEALGVKLTLDLLTSLSDRDAPHVICHVSPRLCPGYGTYKLTITPKQMKLVCGTLESLSYAISTLLQLMWLYKDDTHIRIPTLLIDDWPELPYRGVLLDFSQGRIPDMLLLEETLDTLSTLKVNQVHLYCRFRSKTPPQWQFCFTRRELLHLVDFCRQRQLTLLPVLEVGPKVQFEDLPRLYGPFTDFLACFSHAEFISCGPRLSSFLLDTSGEEQVDVSEACKMVPLGRDQTLQLCGYPLHDLSTPLLQQLPPNIVFNEYGVKADHDFSSFCTTLAEMGIHFCVCPGTAAWNSLAGCPEAAMHNIYRAVKSGSSQGALGVVVCDWTGKGHLTHQPFAWPGFVVGAGMAWNTQCQWDDIVGPLSDLLSQHVYCDPCSVLGEVIVELGRAETFAIRRATNKTGEYVHNLPEEHGSVLFRLLTYPDGVPLEHLSTDTLQLVSRHVKTCQTALNKVAEWEGYVRTQGVIKELLLTIDFMLLACKIGKALVLAGLKPGSQSSAGFSVVNFGVNNLTATARTDLANRLLELSNTYKEVWTQRYLDSVGLTDSMATLRSLLRLLLPESHSDNLLHSPSKTA